MSNYVVVCIPSSWPYLPTKFFMNFFRIVARAAVEGYNVNMIYSASPFMDTNRDELLMEALKSKPDYILFLDADQLYPVDTIRRLAKQIDEGKLVVGGMTPHRTDGRAILFQWDENDEWKGKWSQTIGPNMGTVKVGGMGFGGIMLSPKVAEILPHPRFEMISHPHFHYKIGEDIVFYKKCSENGIDVWCDTALLNKHLNIMELEISPSDKYTTSVSGFMNDDELDWLYQQAKTMNTIVEIGSWKGRSTNALCSGCKGMVHAVDHWRGSPYEHDKIYRDVNGEDIFKEFQENTKQYKNLNVLKMGSLAAAPLFMDKSIDMVFIDGGHSYEECKADIDAWLPKTKRLICGHDYVGWKGVKQAVGESFPAIDTINSIWYRYL